MAVEYTSALRAMPGMGDNESLLKCLRKYPDAFEEVILFAGTGFASRSLAYHQKKAEEVKRALFVPRSAGNEGLPRIGREHLAVFDGLGNKLCALREYLT